MIDVGKLKLPNDQTPQQLDMSADATEAMAKSYTNMEKDCNRWERLCRESWENNLHLRRRISSLQGVATKLKKKLAAMKDEA